MNLAFLASHNGSNLQAIVDACRDGRIRAQPKLVISNNEGSGALVRAQAQGILAFCLNSKTHPDPFSLEEAMLNLLVASDIDLIILAGYMRKLGSKILKRYAGRVINIHPALLPKFGGQGMYGMHVHEAVLRARETETGATVHVVTENYDEGPILAQKRVPVLATDTAELLAARVLEVEHQLYVDTVAKIVTGEIQITQRHPI